MPETLSRLSAAIADLADADAADPALHAAVLASVATLNEGVVQMTTAAHDPETIRKHRARLRAALRAMAAVIREEEDGCR